MTYPDTGRSSEHESPDVDTKTTIFMSDELQGRVDVDSMLVDHHYDDRSPETSGSIVSDSLVSCYITLSDESKRSYTVVSFDVKGTSRSIVLSTDNIDDIEMLLSSTSISELVVTTYKKAIVFDATFDVGEDVDISFFYVDGRPHVRLSYDVDV